MAATDNTNTSFTSFTITQPFLGAPLQFSPALGSQELEQLVNAYVPGTASRQDKLSEVTIDFYNNATVDLNTGALVKRFDVFMTSPWQSFEQSPQSQSSGFSPAMYTPGSASSNTFGDSGYGSISATPPARSRQAGRVSKKPAKKDAKKAAEPRLPGFSIMTKDGVDVTTSAGRGTKTKEQREHAHLMRIMKACEDCKRKKVRCDPSHRRQNSEMSRTSTTTSTTSSRKPSASSSGVNPSPTVSVPSLSHSSSLASQTTTPSFDSSSTIDDFVLFPEDAWTPADTAIPEDIDLSQFNFDINDINLDISMDMPDFDFDAFNNMQTFDLSQLSYQPPVPQQQWTGLPGSHPRSHAAISTQPSSLVDDNPQKWSTTTTDAVSHTRPHPSSSTQDSGQSSFLSFSPTTADISPLTLAASSDEIWPDRHDRVVFLDREPSSDSYRRHQEPLPLHSPTDMRQSLFRQSLSESLSDDSSASSPVFSLDQRPVAEHSPTDSSQQSVLQQSPSGPLSDSSPNSPNEYWTESTDKPKRGRESPAAALARRQVSSSSNSNSNSRSSSSSEDWGESLLHQGEGSRHLPASTPRGSRGVSDGIFGLANTCTLVSESLRTIKQGPVECQSLAGDLQRLRTVLAQYHSELRKCGSTAEMAAATESTRDTAGRIQAFGEQLQGLSVCVRFACAQQSQGQNSPLPPVFIRQCQVQARLLLRSLCATINSLNASSTDGSSPGTGNYKPLTSGHNLQLFVPSREGHDRDRHTQLLAASDFEWTYDNHFYQYDSRSTSPRSDSHATRLEEDERRYAIAFYKDAYAGAFAPGVDPGVAVEVIEAAPWSVLMAKPVSSLTQRSIIHIQSETLSEVDVSAGNYAETRAEATSDMQEPATVSSALLASTTYDQCTAVGVGADSEESKLNAVLCNSKAIALAGLAMAFVATIACLVIMASPHSGLGLSPFKAFQHVCQQWTSITSLASVARLALCAALVANPPSSASTVRAVALVASLFGAGNECCGAGVEVDTQPYYEEFPREVQQLEIEDPSGLE